MRTVLISGGGSGIGLACARRFLAEGARVVLCGRSAERLEQAQNGLAPAHPGRVDQRSCDVSLAEDVDDLAAWLAARGQRVDVLVNNAGLFLAGGVLKAGEDQALQLWETQVMGPWRLLKACVDPALRGAAGLTVVNVLSVTALKAYPGCAFYGATKAALKSLMETARAELRGQGVRICNLYPGATETPIWSGRDVDFSRMMDPDDVAAAVLACAAETPRSLVEDLVLRPAGGDL